MVRCRECPKQSVSQPPSWSQIANCKTLSAIRFTNCRCRWLSIYFCRRRFLVTVFHLSVHFTTRRLPHIYNIILLSTRWIYNFFFGTHTAAFFFIGGFAIARPDFLIFPSALSAMCKNGNASWPHKLLLDPRKIAYESKKNTHTAPSKATQRNGYEMWMNEDEKIQIEKTRQRVSERETSVTNLFPFSTGKCYSTRCQWWFFFLLFWLHKRNAFSHIYANDLHLSVDVSLLFFFSFISFSHCTPHLFSLCIILLLSFGVNWSGNWRQKRTFNETISFLCLTR